jgi:prefoldin subunit 5
MELNDVGKHAQTKMQELIDEIAVLSSNLSELNSTIKNLNTENNNLKDKLICALTKQECMV